ncbi:TadE/TadG family type IV pilus assembly protein [Devosia sp. A449]
MMGQFWRRWRGDERGVSAVEFALLLPLLLTVLLGSVTVFDLFRTAQAAEKATFTVGDMLSRRTDAISHSLLEEMLTFVNKTVAFEGTARLRVSSISNVGGALKTDWTDTAGDKNLVIAAIDYAFIPQLAVGDSVILTEVFIPHRAFVAGFGLDRITYNNRAVQRPRFLGKIAFTKS